MITELTLKPDLQRTIDRFEAWWRGEIIDRPPVTLHVKPSRPYNGPVSRHASQRERWLDATFIVDAAIARMEQHEYLGDSFPSFSANLGPEITATLFGCPLRFTAHTSWSIPVVNRAADWESVLATEPDFQNEYWQAVEQITARAIDQCDGRYLVGLTDLHGNYDVLAALRDPESLCLDLVDCPDLVRQAGAHVARAYVAAFERCYRQVRAAGFGSTAWLPMIHDGPAYVPSCDFWCLVSPATARELIWPDILVEMEPLERSIFHLDGPQALPHLDLVLGCDRLNAVQWVYGDGHGRAGDWIDVYRRCRDAGKSVQVLAADAEDALAVLQAIGPAGTWLNVAEPFATGAAAETFLQRVEAVAARSRGAR